MERPAGGSLSGDAATGLEGRHPPAVGSGTPPGDPAVRPWEEAWTFHWASDDGTAAGLVRLALRPDGRAWYWAALVGSPRQPVVVVASDVVAPGRGLEVRAEGLWADHIVETPLDHVSVGCEAFALGLDDLAVAVDDDTRGDLVPFGLDLGWETVGPVGELPPPGAGAGRYELACTVHGEVLVGDEVLTVDAKGGRSHRWGPDPWGAPWQWWSTLPGHPGEPAHLAAPREAESSALLRLAVPAGGVVTAHLGNRPAGPPRWHARYEPPR